MTVEFGPKGPTSVEAIAWYDLVKKMQPEMFVDCHSRGYAGISYDRLTDVGVAGHSYGGLTATMMASGFGTDPPDTRVKAIMPVAASNGILSNAQLTSVTIPTLLMVGTLDGLQSDLDAARPELTIEVDREDGPTTLNVTLPQPE